MICTCIPDFRLILYRVVLEFLMVLEISQNKHRGGKQISSHPALLYAYSEIMPCNRILILTNIPV